MKRKLFLKNEIAIAIMVKPKMEINRHHYMYRQS